MDDTYSINQVAEYLTDQIAGQVCEAVQTDSKSLEDREAKSQLATYESQAHIYRSTPPPNEESHCWEPCIFVDRMSDGWVTFQRVWKCKQTTSN